MKKTFLLFICSIISLAMTASHLTLEQARNTAEEFVRNKAFLLKNSNVITIQQVKPYSARVDGKPSVFAVNFANNHGFVLVGGNQQGDEIIGYCDHGSFDEKAIPANMRAWLDSYIASANHVSDMKHARGIHATSQCHP